jgi:hypothetical protein
MAIYLCSGLKRFSIMTKMARPIYRSAQIRLYEYPQVDPTTYKLSGALYTYQVLVMNGKDLYIFRMVTTSNDEFEKYTAVADELVTTFTFLK